MSINKHTWGTWAVAFFFAVLQGLQPFMHIHLDVDHPIEHHGFHVGNAYEETVVAHERAEHALASTPHVLHTISVDSGIKQEVEPILTPEILGLMLVLISLAVSLQTATFRYLRFNNAPYQSLKRRLPASRAPPQY